MGLRFQPHGSCSYCTQQNIITIEAEGPWNLEFFVKMHNDLKQIIIDRVDFNDYKILVLFKGEACASQDGFDYHLKAVKLGNARAIACSLEHCDNPIVTKALFEKVYNDAPLVNRFFLDSSEALQWLEAY